MCMLARMQYGDTPLHNAARLGEAGSVQALLAAGADKDSLNKVRQRCEL